MQGNADARSVVRRIFLSAASRARGRYGALHLSDEWIATALRSTSPPFVRAVFWELLRPNGALECDAATRERLDTLAPHASYDDLPAPVDSFLQHTRIAIRITPLGERILEHLSLAAVGDSAA